MSWKKQDAFVAINANTNNSVDNIDSGGMKKSTAFKCIETSLLKVDTIESRVLLINSKDLVLTSNKVNIHTTNNSISIPKYGPMVINDICTINKTDVTINGNLIINDELRTGVSLPIIKYLPFNRATNHFTLCKSYYRETNHFVLECNDYITRGTVIVPHYNDNDNDNMRGYILNICIDLQPNNKNSIEDIDIDVIINNQCENKPLIIKMASPYASLSLLWVKTNKWIIHSIGYKTTIINCM